MKISKSNICVSIIMGIAALLTNGEVNAHHVRYSIEYDNSVEQGPSLQNAKIRGQLYKGGNPAGYIQVTTDQNKEFTLNNDIGPNIAIAIFSIEGEKPLNLHCSGNGYAKNRTVIVKCVRNK